MTVVAPHVDGFSLVCPMCHHGLAFEGGAYVCGGCGSDYPVVEGVPHLVPGDSDEQARRQAKWFDEEVDSEYEITRPHGAPALHRWLLSEKFRRATRGIQLDGATVLCVCAGSGMDADVLARRGARVVAADISPGAAARALSRSRRFDVDITPIVADVQHLPFADRSFDIVFVHDGLHHLERPIAGLNEMARVANAAVIVTEPAEALLTRGAARIGLAEEREEAGNRVERLRPREIADALLDAGFTVERSERYCMYYGHEPGRPARVLSAPGLFALARAGIRLVNAVAAGAGNKLVVVGVRR